MQANKTVFLMSRTVNSVVDLFKQIQVYKGTIGRHRIKSH